MNSMKKYIFTAIAAVIAGAGMMTAAISAPEAKLRQAEQIIERFYVDNVDADSIVEEAIRAMLKTLDPHSLYSTPEETRALNEPLQGNFSGVGIQYNMLNDTLYVIQTIVGGPSERVGVLAGDRVIEVNDTVIAGVKIDKSEVQRRLRGPKGTTVRVKVLRGSDKQPIDFTIVRDDIPLYSVDTYYMIDKENGYVRVTRFAESTPEELRVAMRDLKKKGMKNLIIDLEHNGGGYLRSAFEMGNIFLDKGDLIVFTNNRENNPQYYTAPMAGGFPDGRVVVMVNQYSASASEILAGALQDNDRAVIVGRRTFGKGLVQRPFEFVDGSMIRLTTSRYYTPSGRCIQKPYHGGDDDAYDHDIAERYRKGELTDADSVRVDSLELYHTRAGRPVYGGGGIMPDRFVALDTVYFTNYYRDLLAKGLLNTVSMAYVDANRQALKRQFKNVEAFERGFKGADAMIEDLVERGAKEGIEYNAEQMALSRDYIATILKALVARDIFDTSAYYKIMNPMNPTFVEAVEIIRDGAAYDRLLSGEN